MPGACAGCNISMANKQRAMSGYMLYANEQRDAVRADLSVSGSKVTVAEVAKELGRRWKALQEEEQNAYKQQAQQYKLANSVEQVPEEDGQVVVGEDHVALPTSTVRKIVMLDPQVKRVQPEAVAVISQAAELFLCRAAEQAAKVATLQKRRTVKLEDVGVLMNKDKRWAEMGAGALMSSLTAEASRKTANKGSGKADMTAKPLPAGVQPITAFMKA